MPLLDLKTNLKDLKYGHDQYKWGSSNEPYVATQIPATDEPLQTGFSNAGEVLASAGAGAAIGALGGSILGATGAGALVGTAVGLGIGVAGSSLTSNGLKVPQAGTGGPDFLLRGGTLLPNAIADDETRLFKFFKDTKGILFTVKQNLLSRIAVKTQVSPKLLNGDVYTPLSSLIEAAGIPFGLHVNKQGLNPFEETGAYSVNEDLYGVRIKPSQPQINNRLVNLYGAKFLINPNDRLSDPIFIKDNISDDRLLLFSYPGGPNSPLGIGPTKIRLASDPVIKPNSYGDLYNSQINYLVWGYRGLNSILNETLSNNLNLQQFNNSPTSVNGFVQLTPGEIETLEYDYESNFRNNKNYIPSLNQVDFRKSLIQLIVDTKTSFDPETTLMSKAPSYEPKDNKTIEQRVNLGDPGNKEGKNLFSYTNGIYRGMASLNSYDKVNALALYKSSTPSPTGNDLVDFRIGVLDTNNPGNDKTYIHFRAFLDQISDQYTSDWDSIKYIGRGEKFYTYSSFDRKVSLSWTVAAQSKVELIPMYRKLNYLASLCAPDYSTSGYMRGNIITLTIGGYFYEQPGIITGLNYEMNDDNSTWEIAINDEGDEDPLVKELPHLIRVTGFNFTPIHNFAPRKQQNTLRYDPNNTNFYNIIEQGNTIPDSTNIYGNERYIALYNGVNTNWNNR